jgi:hypothetical protein
MSNISVEDTGDLFSGFKSASARLDLFRYHYHDSLRTIKNIE